MSCSGSRGTRAFLSMVRATTDFDHSQASSIYHKALRRARPNQSPPTQEQWDAFLDERIETLAMDQELHNRTYEHLARYLHRAKVDIPDARTFAALKDMDLRVTKAQSALRRQINSAAAFRAVAVDDVEERFHAYRQQYLTEFRGLSAAERPDPPHEWVTGFTKKDMMAVSSPTDRATLYAIYRCQADPDAFEPDPTVRYASIDLETAGPAGRDGFNPENGAIIEVGIVEYDAFENETGRYSQLIAVPSDIAARCGTGAVEVHGITLDDLRRRPTWAAVAPVISERLNGRVMLAQNARFERGWLAHHMNTQQQDFDRWGPTVDTLCVARQHFSALDNHRLGTICERVGVAYTAGHRAEHDADVAGQAFFRMKRHITDTYLSSPARAHAPQPPLHSGTPATRPRFHRLRAADFDPATVPDPWAAHQPGHDVPEQTPPHLIAV